MNYKGLIILGELNGSSIPNIVLGGAKDEFQSCFCLNLLNMYERWRGSAPLAKNILYLRS